MDSDLGESRESLANVQSPPGTMLIERHTHECCKGHSCGRAPSNDTAGLSESHSLFNPVQPEAGLITDGARDEIAGVCSAQTIGTVVPHETLHPLVDVVSNCANGIERLIFGI